MNDEKLDRKQLAAIRMDARRQRITRIRKRTALFAISLAVIFTALVIARQGAIPGLSEQPVQVASLSAPQTAPVVEYEEDDEEEDDDDYEKQAVAPQAQPAGQFYSSDTAAPVQSSQS